MVNRKRIERFARVGHLLGAAGPAEVRGADPDPGPRTEWSHERRSMDFVRDTLADGRSYRMWVLLDDATREVPLVLVDHSLPPGRVIGALETLVLVCGRPRAIVCETDRSL